MCNEFLAFSENDFNNETHIVTFPRSVFQSYIYLQVSIPIIDDDINEGDEVFAVILELIDAVDPNRVDLSFLNACLCTIIDNDRKFNFFTKFKQMQGAMQGIHE